MIDAAKLTEVAADKALKSQKPRAVEPGRYTVILEPRANARFLSLMTGIFNARAAEGPVGNYFTGKEPGRRRSARSSSASVHAQERHRQPDPAADADRAATAWRRGP